jgi:hypothetical protein
MRVVVLMHRQADLTHLRLTGSAGDRLSYLLDGAEEQANQHADDGENNE